MWVLRVGRNQPTRDIHSLLNDNDESDKENIAQAIFSDAMAMDAIHVSHLPPFKLLRTSDCMAVRTPRWTPNPKLAFAEVGFHSDTCLRSDKLAKSTSDAHDSYRVTDVIDPIGPHFPDDGMRSMNDAHGIVTFQNGVGSTDRVKSPVARTPFSELHQLPKRNEAPQPSPIQIHKEPDVDDQHATDKIGNAIQTSPCLLRYLMEQFESGWCFNKHMEREYTQRGASTGTIFASGAGSAGRSSLGLMKREGQLMLLGRRKKSRCPAALTTQTNPMELSMLLPAVQLP